jgi:hypothetical protein
MVEGWQRFGDHLGEAYQVADDIRDVLARPEEMGKPAGQDHHLGRPSAVAAFGALLRLKGLVASAIAAIPPCPGAGDLRGLILLEVQRRCRPRCRCWCKSFWPKSGPDDCSLHRPVNASLTVKVYLYPDSAGTRKIPLRISSAAILVLP